LLFDVLIIEWWLYSLLISYLFPIELALDIWLLLEIILVIFSSIDWFLPVSLCSGPVLDSIIDCSQSRRLAYLNIYINFYCRVNIPLYYFWFGKQRFGLGFLRASVSATVGCLLRDVAFVLIAVPHCTGHPIFA
jgi:hypothetical protein